MNYSNSGKRSELRVVIKPVNWRQFAFTMFLFITAFFFSFVSYIGLFFSWLGTICFTVFGLLNLSYTILLHIGSCFQLLIKSLIPSGLQSFVVVVLHTENEKVDEDRIRIRRGIDVVGLRVRVLFGTRIVQRRDRTNCRIQQD